MGEEATSTKYSPHEMVYSGTKYERPWPKSMASEYPKYHVPV